jgi:hypothetical protein
MARFKELIAKLKWSHVVLAIGLGAFYFYYTLDQTDIDMKRQDIVTARTEIANLNRKLEETKEFEKEFEEKKKKYAELVAELQKVQGALPKQFFLPDLLSSLLTEAGKLAIEINSIKPDPAETAGDLYNSLGFNIEAKGKMAGGHTVYPSIAGTIRIVTYRYRGNSPPPPHPGGKK